MWTGRQAEVGLRKSPVARDFRDDTSPTHRFAINGAPTLRDEWGTHASRSMGHPRCAMNGAPKLCHHSVTIWLAARYICTIRMVSMYSWARIVTQSLRPKARYETPRANRLKPACSVPATPQL